MHALVNFREVINFDSFTPLIEREASNVGLIIVF